MSDDTTGSEDRFPLTEQAELHPEVFRTAFDSGDPDLLARVYEDAAVLVPYPGEPVTGRGLRRANTEFQSLGLPIEVRLRHCYEAGDVALLIVDWVITGTGPDGEAVHIEGTATDVARRGPDGLWRYVIDNPFGVAAPPGGSRAASPGTSRATSPGGSPATRPGTRGDAPDLHDPGTRPV